MRQYAKQLNLYYVYNDGVLTFEDGVLYTLREARIISESRARTKDIKNIHKVKSAFHGVLEGYGPETIIRSVWDVRMRKN
jgi:hypothetical protein